MPVPSAFGLRVPSAYDTVLPSAYDKALPSAFGPVADLTGVPPADTSTVLNQRGEFKKGLYRGLVNTTSGIDATIGQIAEPFAPDFAKRRINNAIEASRESANGVNKARVGNINDIHGIGDFIDYGAGSLGEQGPNILATIGGGLAGRALSGTIGLGKLGSSVLGGGLSVFPQETGGIVQAIHSDPKAMANSTPWSRLGTSALAGAGASALEALPEAGILGKLLSPAAKMGKGVTGKLLGAGEYALKGAAGETVTEGLQSVVEQAAPMAFNQDLKFNTNDIADSMLKGAIGGAAFGTAAGTAAVVKDAFSLGNDHKFDGLVPDNVRAKGDAASLEWLAAGHEKAKSTVSNRIDEIIADPKVSEGVKTKLSESKLNLDTQEGRDSAANRIVAYENGKELGKTLHTIIKPVLDKFSFSEDFPGVVSTKEEKDAHLAGLVIQPKDDKYRDWKNSPAPTTRVDDIKIEDGLSSPEDIRAAIKSANPALSKESVEGYQKSLFELNELFDVFNLNKSDEEWNSMKAVLVANPEVRTPGKDLDTQMWNKPQTKEVRARVLNELFDVAGTKEQKRVVNDYADRMGVKLTPGAAHIIQSYFNPNGSTENANAAVGKRTVDQAEAHQASFDEINAIKHHFIEERSGVAEHRKAIFAREKAILESSIGKDAYQELSTKLYKYADRTGMGKVVKGTDTGVDEDIEDIPEEKVVQYENSTSESGMEKIAAIDKNKYVYDKVADGSNQQKLYAAIDKRAEERTVNDMNPSLSAGMQVESDTIPMKDWAEERMDFSSAILAAKDEEGNAPNQKELNALMNAVSGVSSGLGALVEKSEKEVAAPEWTPAESGKDYASALEKYRAMYLSDKRHTKAAGENKKVHTVEVADHENVKELFDKFGLDFETFIKHAERNFVERRKSEAGNESEFQPSDLPLLALDANQEYITDDNGEPVRDRNGNSMASKLTLLMEDANGKKVRINAHVLTSAMAKMNMTLVVDPGMSYENRTKQTFLQAYAAVLTQLNLTHKRASLDSENLITENMRVYERLNSEGKLETVTYKDVPDEVFKATLSEGAPMVNGWSVKTRPLLYPMFDGGLVPSRGLTKRDLVEYAAKGEITGVTWELHPSTTIKNLSGAGNKTIKATDLMRQSATQMDTESASDVVDESLAETSLALDTSISELNRYLETLKQNRDAPDKGQSIELWEEERASVLAQISEMHERIQMYRDEVGSEGTDGNVEYMIPDFVFETPKIDMAGNFKSDRTKITMSEDFKSEEEKTEWINAGNPVKYSKFKGVYKDLSVYSNYPVAGASRLAFMDENDSPITGKFDELGKALRKVLRAAERIKNKHNVPIQEDYKDAELTSAAFALHSNLEILGTTIRNTTFSFHARDEYIQYANEIITDAMANAGDIFLNNKLSVAGIQSQSIAYGKSLKSMVDAITAKQDNPIAVAFEIRRLAMGIRNKQGSYSADEATTDPTPEQEKQLLTLVSSGDKAVMYFVRDNPNSDLIPHLAALGYNVTVKTKKTGITTAEMEDYKEYKARIRAESKLAANISEHMPKLNQLVAHWAGRYGVTDKVTITTVKEFKGNKHGKGYYQKNADGSHTITIREDLFNTRADLMATFAHEFGHAILNNYFGVFGDVPVAEQEANLEAKSPELYAAYKAYKDSVGDSMIQGRNPYSQAQRMADKKDLASKNAPKREVFTSPAEWLAEQFSRYAMDPTSEESLSYPKKIKALFDAAIEALKEFFSSLKEQGIVEVTYDVPKEFSDFLAKLREEVAIKEAPIQEQQAAEKQPTESIEGKTFADRLKDLDNTDFDLDSEADAAYAKLEKKAREVIDALLPSLLQMKTEYAQALLDVYGDIENSEVNDLKPEQLAKLADDIKAYTEDMKARQGSLFDAKKELTPLQKSQQAAKEKAEVTDEITNKFLHFKQLIAGYTDSIGKLSETRGRTSENFPRLKAQEEGLASAKQAIEGMYEVYGKEELEAAEKVALHKQKEATNEGLLADNKPNIHSVNKDIVKKLEKYSDKGLQEFANRQRAKAGDEQTTLAATQRGEAAYAESLIGRNKVETPVEPTVEEEQPPMADEHGNVVDKGEYGTGYKPNGGTVEDVHENIMGKLQNESLSVLKAHLVTKKESLAAWLAKGELSEAQALTAKAMRKEIKAIERAIAEKSRADFVEDRTKGSNKTVAQQIEDNKNTYFTEDELNEFKDEEVHNEAGHDAGVDGTANDDPDIRKYLQRILGNKVKVLVGQYPEFMSSYAKEGEDTHFVRLSNLVGLGTNKEGVDERLNMFQGFDPAGRASHSAMAGVAESLKGTEAYREMAKFSVQPHVMKQLNVLLANNPEALRQAKTSLSARLAYAFMFYESGQFTVTQPVAKNWFNSAINFIQSVFHMLSSDEKAMKMFTAIQQGKMANATQKKAEDFYKNLGLRSTMENFYANNRTAEALKDALWRMSTAQSTRATASGDVSLQTLSDSLKKEKGTNVAGDKEGFVQARQRMMGEFLNQFGELTKKDEWTNKEIDALMVKIRMNAPVENQREQALRDGIKELFADIFEYMQEKQVERAVFNEGQPMQWEPIEKRADYRMPQVWNASAIVANKEAAIAFFMNLPNITEEKAIAFVENIGKTPMGVTEVRQSEYDVEVTPAMAQLNDRQIYIPDNMQEEASMFLKNSMLEVMGSYIRSAVHRAEFADRFGNDGATITELLKKAEADGVATADEIADARLLVKAVEGTIGLDIDPRLKKFNNTVITAVNFIILGMSLFTSLADVAGIAVKTGNLKDSWHAFKVGVSALFGQLDKAQGYRLAVAIGSVDMTHQLDIVGNVYGGQYIDGWQSRANELLFKINGMTAWNNAMRVAATDIMDMWLLDNANNPDVLRAEGINPDNINWELEGNAFYQQEEVKQGLYRLVDEMVLRPDATQRPAWGSDPHKALFWHLKQFTWSFNQMILLPALRKAKQGDLMPLYMVGSYVPMVMVADFVRGLVQGGGEEPEWKKKLSMSQRVVSGVNRAGVLGVSGMGLEAMSGPAQGKPMAVSLLGPTVGIGYDEATALWDILTPSDADRHTAGEKTFNMIKRVLPFSNVYSHWDTFSVDEDAKT